MENKTKKSNLDYKLNSLFYELRTSPEFSLEDDTVMQKLLTSLQLLLDKKKEGIIWSKRIGILELIANVLSEEIINNEKFCGAISFSLDLLSSILTKESNFSYISQDMIMSNYLKALPILKTNMKYSCTALKVIHSLLSHPLGAEWTFKHGIWDGLIVSCLESQNIFVQKQCVLTACSFLLKADSDLFKRCIQDLEKLRIKFQELNFSLRKAAQEQSPSINQFSIKRAGYDISSKTVLLIYNELLVQTLGKQSMYTKLRSASDVTSQILRSLVQEDSVEIVRLSLRMLLLSSLHKFQEHLFELGTAEQYHLDSMTSDMLSLMKHMINIGRINDLTLASFSLYKFWDIMCKNLKERNFDAELSKGHSILYLMIRIQLVPLNSLFSSDEVVHSNLDDDINTEKDYINLISKWNYEAYEQMAIRKEHKDIVKHLEDSLIDHCHKLTREELNCLTIKCFLEGHTVLEYFHYNAGMILFESTIFMIHFHRKASNLLLCNPRLLQLAIDGFRRLMDKFSIDWKKCYLSVYCLELLCDVIWIPRLNTQVKVSTLRAMASCVRNFIPPAMSALVNVDKQKDSSLLQAGKVLSIYLSDSEWEVRDSALEFVNLCMQLAKNEYPFFVDWILKLNLIEGILFAVGDSETYVQASALNVIAIFVQLQRIWDVIEKKCIKHYAFRSILKAGDSGVRIAGLHLLKMLYSSSRFSNAEINDFVMPVIQKLASDIDDEMRIMALDFINLHLENELISKGMVDGLFPRVTFYKGKITQLQETDIKNLVLSVASWFCHNGYGLSILGCLRDPVEKVAAKAQAILKFICSLISNHNIQHDLEYVSIKNFTLEWQNSQTNKTSEENVSGSMREFDAEGDCQMDEEGVEMLGSAPISLNEENIDKGIDDVLNTPDMEALDRMPTIQYNPTSPLWWWNGDITSNPLTPQEIPTKQRSLSSLQLFRELDSLASDQKDLEDEPEELEHSLFLLLEDIFLEAEPINDIDDQRVRDCY